MKKEKTGIKRYRDKFRVRGTWIEAMRANLSDSDCAFMVHIMMKYGLDAIEPESAELENRPQAAKIWYGLIRPEMEKDWQRWEQNEIKRRTRNGESK